MSDAPTPPPPDTPGDWAAPSGSVPPEPISPADALSTADARPEGYVGFGVASAIEQLDAADVRTAARVASVVSTMMIVGAYLPLISVDGFLGDSDLRLADEQLRALGVFMPAAGLVASVVAGLSGSARWVAASFGIIAIPTAYGVGVTTGLAVSAGFFGDETSLSDAGAGLYLFGAASLVALVATIRLLVLLQRAGTAIGKKWMPIVIVAGAGLALVARVKEIIDFADDLGFIAAFMIFLTLLFFVAAAAGGVTASDEGAALALGVFSSMLFNLAYALVTFDGLDLGLALTRNIEKIVYGGCLVGAIAAVIALLPESSAPTETSEYTLPRRFNRVRNHFDLPEEWDDEPAAARRSDDDVDHSSGDDDQLLG